MVVLKVHTIKGHVFSYCFEGTLDEAVEEFYNWSRPYHIGVSFPSVEKSRVFIPLTSIYYVDFEEVKTSVSETDSS